MPLSDRTKRLLDWWQLRIQKSREETKENVESNNINGPIDSNIRVGNNDKEQ
ncbi:hypothetical protein [Hyphomonas sp.]|uniref:hypothetical protein n=1 Tax=Hyphomonas sp. TaxID=87 RepID=UPI0025C30719|nr:hypothetical protein [Hyphomonas sp.]|tara:strand:+ start:270 stop:425 length:156 start_codon:yes stop_codon:yes gene_type:complete